MAVGEICNREVVITEKTLSVVDAAQLMRQHHVGDLVVVDEKGGRKHPVGIVTDRDIVLEVIAEGVNVNDVSVRDIMSDKLVTAREGDSVLDTVKMMRAKGIRRLPVINDDNELSGILSVDDLIELLSEQTSDLAKLIAREQKHEKEKRS